MNPQELSARIANVYELQSMWMEPRLAKLGISWTSFQLMMAIGAAKGSTQAQVAERLGISPATMSESVKLHVDRGLIAQTASASDRRVKTLSLTKEGDKIMSKVRKIIAECSEVMTEGIPNAKLESCAKVLDDFSARLERSLDS